jgi:hypothetical protein
MRLVETKAIGDGLVILTYEFVRDRRDRPQAAPPPRQGG